MFDKRHIYPRLCGLTTLIVLLSASTALAGGFGLTVQLPGGGTNPKAPDAVLLVTPDGCFGPGATVSGAAEGLVNGKRQSVPLRLTAVQTNEAGVTTFAVRRQWPKEGAWLLSFTGTSSRPEPSGKEYTAVCRAILELAPGGGIPTAQVVRGNSSRYLPIRYVEDGKKDVEKALQSLANKGSKPTAISRSSR